MAHTKAQKATKGNRDSRSKRLGVKLYGGQIIKSGNIIVRQRGTRFFAGDNVKLCDDQSLMALQSGIVHFYTRRDKKYVEVLLK